METVNRLENLVSDIIDMGDSDDMMLAITEVLTDTEIIPDVGKYYTFIYSPKTPRIRYCLLYTSPSPRDRTRSRMPSSA